MLSVNLRLCTGMKTEIAQEGLPCGVKRLKPPQKKKKKKERLRPQQSFQPDSGGNHIKMVETWQAANIITIASFSFFFLFLSIPVSNVHVCFHYSSSLGMKGIQLDDVKKANAET